jgi:UDP-N-acetylmuramate dehydrogenase
MALSPAHKQALIAALADEGEARFDEPMGRHTTLRIGGPADAWLAPSTIAAVQRVRRLCTQAGLPCRALGAGSNLLVRDGGVRGVLLASERLRGLQFSPPGADGLTAVYVEAGVSTGKLLSQATRRGLGGVEFLGGVPGSIGGGLVMNAGTYLGEFKDVTVQVDSVDAGGELLPRPAAACGFVYRGSALPPAEVIVAGHLRLPPRPIAEIEQAVRALRDRRREREPHGFPNAGSIFKNPPGDFAGRLIEACGLKGTRVGDAEVAGVHANWILNVDKARAQDVLSLIALVQAAVVTKFKVELELEVKVMGEVG